MTEENKEAEVKEEKVEKTDELKDAFNNIWMAGIGALSTVEKEGTKIFKGLVEKGLDYQTKTKELSEKQIEKISGVIKGGVSSAKTTAKSTLDSAKGSIGDPSSIKDSLLEKIKVEEIVSGALNKFGVATKSEIEKLTKQVKDLNKTVRELKTSARKSGKSEEDVTKAE